MAYCGFYTDLFDILVIVETNTGGHGITEFGLSVIDIEFDQSRNVEEEWRCIFVFVIKIYTYIDYIYANIYISISLVCFLFGLHGSHSSTINQYQYQIGSVFSFRAEQIRRVQSINQSVASHWKWHRIVYSYSIHYFFYNFCLVLCSFCVLCNSCVVLRIFTNSLLFCFVCWLFAFLLQVPQSLP